VTCEMTLHLRIVPDFGDSTTISMLFGGVEGSQDSYRNITLPTVWWATDEELARGRRRTI
jgi:hypothetical protein